MAVVSRTGSNRLRAWLAARRISLLTSAEAIAASDHNNRNTCC
jgi:hypothetical protein